MRTVVQYCINGDISFQ